MEVVEGKEVTGCRYRQEEGGGGLALACDRWLERRHHGGEVGSARCYESSCRGRGRWRFGRVGIKLTRGRVSLLAALSFYPFHFSLNGGVTGLQCESAFEFVSFVAVATQEWTQKCPGEEGEHHRQMKGWGSHVASCEIPY